MSANVDVSPPPVSSAADAGPRQPERDDVSSGVIIVVVLAAIVVMACSVWVAWTIANTRPHDDRAGRWGAPSADVQAIEMSLLPRADADRDRREAREDAASAPRRDLETARRHLSSYGYTDREHGTLHIPLARAKQLYLERSTKPVPPARRVR